MADHEGQGEGLSRRKMLKGGAIAGAAVWAVPTAQLIGMDSAHAQSASPPPPPPPPPPDDVECKTISNIQIIVKKSGCLYGLKWDDGFERWSSAAPNSNDCIRYFESETNKKVVASGAVASVFNSKASVTIVNDCEWRLALPLPSGYVFVAGYVKAGNVSTTACPKAATPTATYVPFLGAPKT
jgi:hypothetical protein